MKIAFVLSVISGRGGPQRFTSEIGARLIGMGHDVRFYTWHHIPRASFDTFHKFKRTKSISKRPLLDSFLRAIARICSSSSIYLFDQPLSTFTNLLLILKALVEFRPDVVVVLQGHALVALFTIFYKGLLVCRYGASPATARTSILARFLRPLERLTLWKTFAFTNNHNSMQITKSRLGIELPIIPSAVNLDRFSSGERRDDGRTLLYFSQIRPNKKQLFLIELMPQLLKKQEARLIIAGDVGLEHQEYLRELRIRVDELGLRRRIRIVSNVTEEKINNLYLTSTLYLHPVKHEPFGTTIIEAMACGKPVVIHRTVGLAHVLANESFCSAVGDDPVEWINSIVAMLNSPNYVEMSKEARMKARDFSRENIAKKFESSILEKLGEKRLYK